MSFSLISESTESESPLPKGVQEHFRPKRIKSTNAKPPFEDGCPNAPVEDCGIMLKTMPQCDSDTCQKSPGPEHEEDPEAQEIVREVLTGVIRKAMKAKLVRRRKKPVLKSKWMRMREIIPNFDINDDIYKRLCFDENLMVSMFEENEVVPHPVGALFLGIQAARGGPLKKPNRNDFIFPKFLVHLSSQLQFMGYNGGSRITAWVDRDLQTLEEKRREYLKLDEGLDDQSLHVSSQDKFYYVRHNKTNDSFYSPERANKLICEGSNFVLMRYLAQTKFVGTFETTTLYIDGSLCRNIYECKGPSSGLVNDHKLDVCKIYRTVIEECGIEHKMIALMTLEGQILKEEWHSCNYILQINPLVDLTERTTIYEKIPLENEAYGKDLQLLSVYLDAQTSSKKFIENYMEDHPEIRDMLSDYVQTILQLKPDDVFEFTAKYFLSFTPALLPLSEYFERPINEDEEDDDYEFWKYI